MNANTVVQNILAGKSVVPNHQGFAFAPINFALIKYWGKRDTTLNLPVTSSLSLGISEKGAFTEIECIDNSVDEFLLNHQKVPLNSAFTKRISSFLDFFRTKENYHFRIRTQMNLPQASGLASSACGFAALTLALDQLFNWQLTQRDLSILARLGSGSACRSLWPGFVEWHAGNCEDGMDSYASPISATWDTLCMGLLVLDATEKPISSREAMQKTLKSSCYYSIWPDKVAKDLDDLKQVIYTKNFEQFGQICESNALAMHAAMLTAWPPIFYWTPQSLEAIQKIWRLRSAGLPLYFTQDAGPNLKLLFLAKDLSTVKQAFENLELVWPFSPSHHAQDVVLVDKNDCAQGVVAKITAHEKALCHRAFSVFLFRKNGGELELLIQQRQHDKYHCAGLWTNTCCSHPRPGESLLAAAKRRLQEEIGVETLLSYKGSFHYIASFDNHLTENEVDHVFVGYDNPKVLIPNKQEIAELRWVSVCMLKEELSSQAERYTPWFKRGLEMALRDECF